MSTCHGKVTLTSDYANFIGGFNEGKDVIIRAKVPGKDGRFSIDFCVGSGDDADIGLHICVHMDDEKILFNTLKDGKWVKHVEPPKPFPFYPGAESMFKIYSFQGKARIELDGTEFGDYDDIIPARFVNYLRIGGLKDAQVSVSDH